MADDFYFYGSISKEEFLGNIDSRFCREAKENIDGLTNLFSGEDLVLLTKTNQVSARGSYGRPRSYFGDRTHCLANPKEISIFYFAREPKDFPYSGGNDIGIGVRIDANGLVCNPSSIANMPRGDRLWEGEFSIVMDADIFSNGKFEDNKYSTRKKGIAYLPIEVSSRVEEIDEILKRVYWEGGILGDEGFFGEVLKSFNEHEKSRKPIISVQVSN